MVMCSAMDSVVIPRPPALPSVPLVLPPPPPLFHKPPQRIIEEEHKITERLVQTNRVSRNPSIKSKLSNKSNRSTSNGFRLIENNNISNTCGNNNNNDDTGSVYSIYKQKIDSMFESDSSTSQQSNNNHTNNNNNNKNSVQAKIEKMFSEVAQDTGVPLTQIGVHSFSVDYLGSVVLAEKVTSLSGLQTPLKELYFTYKKSITAQKVLSGRLEISAEGLKVQYQSDTGDKELSNSFPTIAVWSAVKFVLSTKKGFAFLPLITDPDNLDKQMLFQRLEEGDLKCVKGEKHSPLFAVVMRKPGGQKCLECHGFVCQTSEDAIVIAATLYKSLVNHMKNKERKPKNMNGLTSCMSTASSTFVEKNGNSVPVRPPRKKRSSVSSVTSDNNDFNISDSQPLLPPVNNSKLPKKSVKNKRAPEAPQDQIRKTEDPDAILPYEDPITLPNTQNDHGHTSSNSERNQIADNMVQEIKPISFSEKINSVRSKEQRLMAEEIKQVVSDTNKGLKHMPNFAKPQEDSLRKKENAGDILTKVTIPRSGSFLNTGGLTRYKNKISRNNDSTSGGSPLGFKEIFNELSLQEGLHSMDDILSVIIDPDGMSFNDLKPIYKEFLLKLSLTLTKDELYQKSRSIMRRQKKKLIGRNVSNARKSSSRTILVGGKFKRFKHVFQKNLKMKIGKKGRKLPVRNENQNTEVVGENNIKLPESSISTSSYDTRQFRTKEELTSGKKQSYRKKTDVPKNRRRDRASTSEESDFFSLKRNKIKQQNMNLLALNQNRNSSSGYVSCSECSYDSDTCTCVSADKCYCSLGHKHFGTKRRDKCCCVDEPNFTFCGCDTDSCAESNKCYCQFVPQTPSPHGLLPHLGFVPPNTPQTLLELEHPHHHNDSAAHSHRHKKLCKKNSNTRSTKSLEYMSNPSEAYYEKLKTKSKFGSDRQFNRSHAHGNSNKRRRNSHLGVSVHKMADDDFAEMAAKNGERMVNEYDLVELARQSGSLRQLQHLQRAMMCVNGQFCDNRSGGRGNSGKKGGRTLQSSVATTGACTEALAVKKSAEIAALFADIKLSQTTDITHLLPPNYDVTNVIHSSKNYSRVCQAKYAKPSKVVSNNPNSCGSNRLDTKAVYAHHRSSHVHNNLKNAKNNMYSARNGLYTIQSQSDESRRSSVVSDRKQFLKKNDLGDREYFELEQNVSSNIENSLGYLP